MNCKQKELYGEACNIPCGKCQPYQPNESRTPVKTIDELLIGTKYEGAEHYLDGGSACSMSPNVAMQRAKRDALKNAVLASLLPAAVKALEEIDKMMREIVGRHAHRENNALVIEGFTGCKADDASKLIQAILTRISEATKAVGE